MTNSAFTIARVISVCTAKDIETWTIACKRIIKCIEADQYLVVVPDQEVKLFESITVTPYQVIPESLYVGDLKSRLRTLLPIENHDRIGWYLQQFIKIAAAKELGPKKDVNQLVLIWDADTVPLNKLNFVDDQGRVLYYCGTESHTPYFEFIKRLFPWAKRLNFSFIAQCLPAKINWVQDFCGALESEGRDWVDSIIAHLDQSQRAGFSEYESMGTYIWNRYPNMVALNQYAWERNGRSLVGNPEDLSELEFLGLSSLFDYISFEAWDVNHGIRARIKAWMSRLEFARIGRKSKKVTH